MKRFLDFITRALLFFVGYGCTPHPVSPTPDAADATALASAQDAGNPEQIACNVMAAVGCTIIPDTCAVTIRKVNADGQHFEKIDVVCISQARTPQDVIDCGTSCTPKTGE